MGYNINKDNPIFQLRLGKYKGQSVKAALMKASEDRDAAATSIVTAQLIPWLVAEGYLKDR